MQKTITQKSRAQSILCDPTTTWLDVELPSEQPLSEFDGWEGTRKELLFKYELLLLEVEVYKPRQE